MPSEARGADSERSGDAERARAVWRRSRKRWQALCFRGRPNPIKLRCACGACKLPCRNLKKKKYIYRERDIIYIYIYLYIYIYYIYIYILYGCSPNRCCHELGRLKPCADLVREGGNLVRGTLCRAPCAGSPWALWGLEVCPSKKPNKTQRVLHFCQYRESDARTCNKSSVIQLKNAYHSQSIGALSLEIEIRACYFGN